MIAFDIDGCVNCIKEDIVDLGRSYFKSEKVVLDESGYYLRDIYSGAEEKRYDEFWVKYGYEIYTNPPREGFISVVKYLKEKEIEACYITTIDLKKIYNGSSFKDITESWLRRYEIELPVYYRKDKDAIALELGVELMVEDKPDNIMKLQKVTEVLIFDHPYNISIKGNHVNNWYDVLAWIKKIKDSGRKN